MKGDFYLVNIIFQDYVEVYGLDDFTRSMRALETFTKGSTSEFAIRAFLLKDEDKTMAVMKKWAKSENEEVRRLASEGCRPRLPWAVALPSFKKDPTKVLEVLEILKDDTSKYVQKSVANNLNDISKDNANTLKIVLKTWFGKTSSRDWILKHGSRTLLKRGDSEVLEYFGFKRAHLISVVNFKVAPSVKLGEELLFEFELLSTQILGKLRVEFSLEFVRLNGKSSTKVFKICEGEYATVSKDIAKKFPFKIISTRKYYEGEHALCIIVNGERKARKKFMLES
jgi:3-methyladenine DNA glycosylase AlkC